MISVQQISCKVWEQKIAICVNRDISTHVVGPWRTFAESTMLSVDCLRSPDADQEEVREPISSYLIPRVAERSDSTTTHHVSRLRSRREELHVRRQGHVH